jgi:hypothetical protein
MCSSFRHLTIILYSIIDKVIQQVVQQFVRLILLARGIDWGRSGWLDSWLVLADHLLVEVFKHFFLVILISIIILPIVCLVGALRPLEEFLDIFESECLLVNMLGKTELLVNVCVEGRGRRVRQEQDVAI